MTGAPETSEKRRIHRLFGSRRKSSQPRQGKSPRRSIELSGVDFDKPNSNQFIVPAKKSLINVEDSVISMPHNLINMRFNDSREKVSKNYLDINSFRANRTTTHAGAYQSYYSGYSSRSNASRSISREEPTVTRNTHRLSTHQYKHSIV